MLDLLPRRCCDHKLFIWMHIGKLKYLFKEDSYLLDI